MSSEKKILIKFRNEFVDIMYGVNPEYEQCVIKENGIKYYM